MGAGLIPFSTNENTVYFLFQKVFHGRKSGFLIDFGGGINEGETYQQAAIREFVEETETLFFSSTEELKQAHKTPSSINHQINYLNTLFNNQPHWYCQREPGNKYPPKDWYSFFIEVPYQDLAAINQEWKNSIEGRFSKRRELHWVSSEKLLSLYKNEPLKLWKRVRQLKDANAIIQDIVDKIS